MSHRRQHAFESKNTKSLYKKDQQKHGKGAKFGTDEIPLDAQTKAFRENAQLLFIRANTQNR